MKYPIGLENGADGRSIAWVLGHPGCFAHAKTGEVAVMVLPKAIHIYRDWIKEHAGDQCWLPDDDIQTEVVETWEVYTIDSRYSPADECYDVNAWFKHDWKPLTAGDVERGLLILEWSRQDLLAPVAGLDEQILETEAPDGWDIAEILRHVGSAEWWYLSRLGLACPRNELPADPFKRLTVTRQNLRKALTSLIDSEKVVGIDGEFWSPRKLLRRAAWHERDHIIQIEKLVKAMQELKP